MTRLSQSSGRHSPVLTMAENSPWKKEHLVEEPGINVRLLDYGIPSTFGWSDYLGTSAVQSSTSHANCFSVFRSDATAPSSPTKKSSLDVKEFPVSFASDDYPSSMEESSTSTSSDIESDIEYISGAMSSHTRLRRRKVTFQSVRVREYSMCLGDHPWADSYPLQLDWSHGEQDFEYSLCDFEAAANHRRCPSAVIRQLSALERKLRLKTVTGLTFDALDQLEMDRIRDGDDDSELASLAHSTSCIDIKSCVE